MTIKENHHRVVIIGAGAAGLFAARTLIKSGNFSQNEIVILEAQDYIGGRIKTIMKNGIPLELGAQWIHGRGNNPLWKFVQEKGINISKITNTDGKGIYVSQSGKLPPERLCDETVDFLDGLHDEINDLIDENGNLPLTISKMSLGDYWQLRFKEWIEKFKGIESEENIAWRKKVYHWKILWENCDCSGDDVKMASIMTRAKYEAFDGQNATFGSGYSSIIESLLQELKDKVEIKLETEVVKVKKDDINGRTIIATMDGSVYYCDTCIVTVSLGVIKANHKLFDNETVNWSPSVVKAIRRIRFGNICRIKLEFEERFWDETTKGIMILRDSDSLSGYDDDDDNDPLFHYIYGFDTIIGHPNMLMGWLSGDEARFIEELSDKAIGEGCLRLLRGATSQMKLRCPIKLKDVIVTRWHTNRFTQGTYSHATNECDRKEITHADLLEPVTYSNGYPAVMLAGEATEDCFAGTVHGAMCSGEKQANRLLNMNAHIMSLHNKVELETA